MFYGPVANASTSTMRVMPSVAALATTRIFVVVRAEKVIFFQTRLLPVMTPPGTVAQALPVQYCTVNAVVP